MHSLKRFLGVSLLVVICAFFAVLVFFSFHPLMSFPTLPLNPDSENTPTLLPGPTSAGAPNLSIQPPIQAYSPTPFGTLVSTPTVSPFPTPVPTPTSNQTAIFKPPWLHTSSQNIYDNTGKHVKLYICCIQNGDRSKITTADLQKIGSMGFNAVRITVYWGVAQPNNNSSVNTSYFTSGAGAPDGTAIDDIISWASQLGMYVLLSPAWSASWPFPSWAASSTGLSSGELSAYCDLFHNSEIQSGVDYLYNWMAKHYATNSNVIFESFNELATTSYRDASAPFADFNSGWISAVETGEGINSHLKIVELLYDSECNYQLTGPFVSGNHSNVLLATHDYPIVDSSQIIANQWISIINATISKTGLPWIDTEFSTACGGNYNNLTYATSLLAQYNLVGWGYYCYNSSPREDGNYNINNPGNAASIIPILKPLMVQP